MPPLPGASAYDVDPETAHRAALYIAWRLGPGCGDILDMLGLRSSAESPLRGRDSIGRSTISRSRPRAAS